jgi:hypothetical protein
MTARAERNGHPAPGRSRGRLRLVKVVVQPVFMWDEGESLRELQHPPVEIPADEWATYPERFAVEASAWERQLQERDDGT